MGRLLDDLAAAFRRHLYLQPHEPGLLALWVAHAATLEMHHHSPRLFLWSATPGSGKSTVLDMLELLLPSAKNWSSATASTVFRTLDEGKHVLLLDEADKWLMREPDLIGALNSGHKRNGRFPRQVKGDGGDWELREFATWGAVAIAAKNRMPPADLVSRSLKVVMVRAKPGQVPAPFTSTEHADALGELAGRLNALAADERVLVAVNKTPERPEWLYGRAWDNWRPLFAVAQAAGGEWPARVREMARVMSRTPDGERDTGERLLAHLWELFERQEWEARAYSDDIVMMLNADEEWPYGGWNGGKGITKRQLAAMLKKFGIRPDPKVFRLRGRAPSRGYWRDAFADAWERYGVKEAAAA